MHFPSTPECFDFYLSRFLEPAKSERAQTAYDLCRFLTTQTENIDPFIKWKSLYFLRSTRIHRPSSIHLVDIQESSFLILLSLHRLFWEYRALRFLHLNNLLQTLNFSSHNGETQNNSLDPQGASENLDFAPKMISYLEYWNERLISSSNLPLFEYFKSRGLILEHRTCHTLALTQWLNDLEKLQTRLLPYLHTQSKLSQPKNPPSMNVAAPFVTHSPQSIYQSDIKISLSPDQAKAVEIALENNLCLLTGGPGTGKTTVLAQVVLSLLEKNLIHLADTAFATPTGLAAGRLRESLHASLPAYLHPELRISTLHRLLEANSQGFQKNQKNPLEARFIIIDEASMVSSILWQALLNALSGSTRLIFCGDPNQLPPVQSVSLFKTLCTHPQIPQALLSTCHRSDKKITELAQNWIRGKLYNWPKEVFLPSFQRDLYKKEILSWYTSEGALAKYQKEASKTVFLLLNNLKNLNPISKDSRDERLINPTPTLQGLEIEINDPTCTEALNTLLQFWKHRRILTAQRQGPLGCDALNLWLGQESGFLKNPDEYSPGWPLVVRKNQASLDVNNGDAGLYFKIANEEYLILEKQGSPFFRCLPLQRISKYDSALVLTIHLAQGQEYESVLLVFDEQFHPLYTQELVYTGITRAKKSVKILASEKLLKQIIERESSISGDEPV